MLSICLLLVCWLEMFNGYVVVHEWAQCFMYGNVHLFSNHWVEFEKKIIPINFGNGLGNPIIKIQKLIQKIDCSFKHHSLN
jgi:hypothetical protein